MELEFQRNKERFAFLKWGSSAFHNMLVVPPGSGIVHQVNIFQLGDLQRSVLHLPFYLFSGSHEIWITFQSEEFIISWLSMTSL